MVVAALPLVSIITPVYNGSRYLEELIQSVLLQDYSNIEHLIIDDGSQDDGATIAVLQKYPHVRWWSQANKGQYATMNEGLAAARGEIICFVSADDTVSPAAAGIAVRYLLTHPFMDGAFGITGYMDEQGKDQHYPIPFRMAPIRFYPYFAHVSHCSLYVKKQSIQRHGLVFDPSLRFVGDYEWIIRLHKSRLRIGFIHSELAKVRIHSGQTSRNYHKASTLEAKAVLDVHHINRLAYLILSTINIFLIRLSKVIWMIRSFGLRGTVVYLMGRVNHT